MTNSEIREMLKSNTNMSDFDIARHIEDGVMVYSSYDEYRDECIASLCDEDEIAEMWESLEEMEFNGETVKVDFVL